MITDTDPKPIAEVLDSALGELLAEWRSEYAKDAENTSQPGFCRHCGVSLGDRPEDLTIPMGRLGHLPNVCCVSCSEAGKERLKREDQLAREQMLAHIVPTEFMHWDEKLGNNEALSRALGKFSMTAKKGVVLHGSTGSCKTRIAWELVKRIAMQPETITWTWMDAFEASQQKGIGREAYNSTWLIIDDLGNEQKKGWETKWETELLHLIRKRCEWHRPIIITTQLTPTAFKQRFFNGVAADAIMRRFRERTESVATDRM